MMFKSTILAYLEGVSYGQDDPPVAVRDMEGNINQITSVSLDYDPDGQPLIFIETAA